MKHILVFGGTTEGRLLAQRLARLPVKVTVCVATEYGKEMLRGLPEGFAVRVGRMDVNAITAFMQGGGFEYVIDATHPYAAEVTANISRAAGRISLPHMRLAREEGGEKENDLFHVENAGQAAAFIDSRPGNALLATGVKDLAAYIAVRDFSRRLFPRVLPAEESIRECVRLGYRRSRIIAMQGPFGREFNRALMRHFAISILVTKDGGKTGGFAEKILAAEDVGASVCVIGRPGGATGRTLDEILAILQKRLEAQP